MIKSKHFRKDVIIARVIFLAFCALVIAGFVWLISTLTGGTQPKDPNPSEGNSSQMPSESESESESDSQPEKETCTKTETESETETETQPTEDEEKLYAVVTSQRHLNLRKEPNTNCEILASLPNGTKVEVLEELDGWLKVSYEDHVGYVSSDYVRLVEE